MNEPVVSHQSSGIARSPVLESGRALREEYEQWIGIMELSRRYRMTYRAVRSELIRQWAKIRKQGTPAGSPRNGKRKLAAERIPELLALCADAGLSLFVIGRRMGITRQRVSQIARAHGRCRA